MTMPMSSSHLPSFADLPALRQELRKRIPAAVATCSSAIATCSMQIEPCDLLEWLEAQSCEQKLYWSQEAGGSTTAGAGAAEILRGETADDLRRILNLIEERTGDTGVYFGGARFSHTTPPDDLWQPFHGCMFVLPRVRIHTDSSGSTLTLYAVVREGTDPADELLEAVDSIAAPVALPHHKLAIAERTDTPDREGWQHNIDTALHSFATGDTEKIVLARRATLHLREQMSPWALTRLLGNPPRAFVFCFQPEDGTAFLGATPEQLYWRQDNFIFSEAVAGTRPRGATEEGDQQKRDELFHSAKDRHEHEVVRRHIISVLERFGSLHSAEEQPEIIALPRLFHLRTLITSEFNRAKYSDADLLPALYPTPAVGGTPRETAIKMIDTLEGFDRGWYAGTVGWAGSPVSTFAVAIRSGLLRGDTLHLFSGAGIVTGSDAQAEWEEIELKLGNFLTLIGNRP